MRANSVLEVALYALLALPLILVILDSSYRLLFLAVIHLPARKGRHPSGANEKLRLLILLVAHNEQRTIERTLSIIKTQTDGDGLSRVLVLADHCSDDTAAITTGMAIGVCRRDEGLPGKAQALSWLASEAADQMLASDVVVVLDADSLVQDSFCQAIRDAFEPEIDAVQSFVNPISANGFPLTTLVSFSEILAGKIDDAARSRLGWSVPLRGTGMAFRTSTFIEACQHLGTQVDDIELSVRLAELGVRVRLQARAVVGDPKAERVLGLARQRGRWLKGQRQVWRTKGRSIGRLLAAGPQNWSLIQAMLLKPKTAVMTMRLGLLAAFWAWPFPSSTIHDVLVVAVAASLLVDLLYYLVGLQFVDEASRYLLSLLASPLLLVLWVISWAYSLLPTREWLRAQKE